MTTQQTTKTKYLHSGLKECQAIVLKNRLEQMMFDERLFTNKRLNLGIVADRLNTSYHNISQVISQSYKTFFFQFLNMLRIDEAKRFLSSPDYTNHKVLEIAYQVGFCTRNSFNKTFKRLTGLTPSAYRKWILTGSKIESLC